MSAENHNVVRYLAEAAGKNPDRTALAMPARAGGSISYSDLYTRVSRFSEGISRAGLKPGDRTICMVQMSCDLYTCMLGFFKMGAVTVFVDPWIGPKQIAAFCAYASPSAYIGIPKSHLLRLLNPILRQIKLSVTTGHRLGPIPARWTLREIEANSGSGEIFRSSSDDPALITFTTGSSGTPKGANRTHGFLDAQHKALKHEFPYSDDDVDMPMFPVFALNNLALGITSVIPDMDFRSVSAVDPARIIRQMKDHGVTTSTASPPFFDRLADHVADRPGDAPALRRIMTGGAPVSDRQLEKWHKAFPGTEITVVYGSTEAEPVAHIDSHERLEAVRSAGSACQGFCAGKPTSLLKTRIIEISDSPVQLDDAGWKPVEKKTGEIGELVVCGEHVCKDYYKNSEAVRENKIIDSDGRAWHRMGDTGYFDANGLFWVTGRTHSTIHRAGQMIHPQLAEQAASSGNNWQVAAVGCADPELGQKAVLAVYPHGQNVDQAELKRKLADAGITIDAIIVTNRPLPVDPRHNSKIDYGTLRQQIEQGILAHEQQ